MMFKAKIIEDISLYQKLRKQIFWVLMPLGLLSLFTNVAQMPLILFIFSCVLLIVALIAVRKKRYIFEHLTADKTFEADKSNLTIKEKGDKIVSFSVSELDKIRIKSVVDIGEGATDLINIAKGNIPTSFMEIEKKGHKERFEFIIESHYMMVQINKLIEEWKANQLQVEVVN